MDCDAMYRCRCRLDTALYSSWRHVQPYMCTCVHNMRKYVITKPRRRTDPRARTTYMYM